MRNIVVLHGVRAGNVKSMTACGRVVPAQNEPSLWPALDPRRLAEANINPASGLSTDYLNHFNEAVMLLEMAPDIPECRQELANWRPLSYHEHFRRSQLRHRDLMMAAYDRADPAIRAPFDALCERMKALVVTAAAAMMLDLPAYGAAQVADETVSGLKTMIMRASVLIHGQEEPSADGHGFAGTQAAVDAILTA
jgi:hypothetical protein